MVRLFKSGWKFTNSLSCNFFSKKKLTTFSLSFNKAKGDTDPGVIPKYCKRYSFFAKEIFPRFRCFAVLFKLISSSSSQEIKKNLFFLFLRNKFLLWAPFVLPLNFFDSSTVKRGLCSCNLNLYFFCSKIEINSLTLNIYFLFFIIHS